MTSHRIIDSPIGELTLVVDDADRLTGVYMPEQRHLPDAATFGTRDDTCAEAAAGQLREYFAGERTDFDLDVAPRGTDFQQEVWRALSEIPYGTTTTYGELATALGRPHSARAVGAATGRNPLSIVVPCHRLVGHNGSLVGYAGGLDSKRTLLAHEQRADMLPG